MVLATIPLWVEVMALGGRQQASPRMPPEASKETSRREFSAYLLVGYVLQISVVHLFICFDTYMYIRVLRGGGNCMLWI